MCDRELLELAAKAAGDLEFVDGQVYPVDADNDSATRRAIVRAAAEIGKTMRGSAHV